LSLSLSLSSSFSLQTHTERHIQAALQQVTMNHTTLIIAHRLSTIVHADQIMVMQHGRITESGTHAELMSDTNGYYHDMWMKQLEETKKEAEKGTTTAE
jgi:ATP-binding cassette subfamily B protein